MKDEHRCSYQGCVLPGGLSHDVGGAAKRFVCRFHFRPASRAQHDAVSSRIEATITSDEQIRQITGYGREAQQLMHYLHTGEFLPIAEFVELDIRYRAELQARASQDNKHALKWLENTGGVDSERTIIDNAARIEAEKLRRGNRGGAHE